MSPSRTHSWDQLSTLAATTTELGGLEFVTALLSGAVPAPPIMALVEAELVEVEPGRCVLACRPGEWMMNAMGVVHGGIAATLLDLCMALAVHSTLPAGSGCTSTDLHVRYVRSMNAETGTVLAEGTVVHTGRRHATAQSRLIVKDRSALIAHATTGCMILHTH